MIPRWMRDMARYGVPVAMAIAAVLWLWEVLGG